MTEEIKEILDTPIFIIDNEGFTVYINDKINDYITNLQKENQSLKNELKSKPDNEITLETKEGQIMTIIQSERIDMQEKLNKSLEEMYKKYQDYKSRNEKAIEYIENHTENIDRGTYYEDYVETYDLLNILEGYDLLNILEGGDEE